MFNKYMDMKYIEKNPIIENPQAKISDSQRKIMANKIIQHEGESLVI